MELTAIQNEIQKALVKLGDRVRFSEAILAKKIREECKIDGKKKAGLALTDLEKVAAFLEDSVGLHYSFMLNSANDLLIEKTEQPRLLEGDVRQRRLKSEKSMSLFTSSDLKGKESSGKKKSRGHTERVRTERHVINIYSDFETLE